MESFVFVACVYHAFASSYNGSMKREQDSLSTLCHQTEGVVLY